jgi:hypothetical protein
MCRNRNTNAKARLNMLVRSATTDLDESSEIDRSPHPRDQLLRVSPYVQHELPSLQLRKKAERRHAGARVAAGNLPEERPVALRLNVGRGEIGGARRSASVIAMACAAPLMKQLPAACHGLRAFRQRVRFGVSAWRSEPFTIRLAVLFILSSQRHHAREEGSSSD